ncbi:hypothetical protein BHM03_00008849 [Ensete ventricosum]|nr:hypothetical protein BHM03_00008849 [Ensete ventricosum]
MIDYERYIVLSFVYDNSLSCHFMCFVLQVDNRSSSAGKRARTDGMNILLYDHHLLGLLPVEENLGSIQCFSSKGGRREDDWTCPSCGNVNFSFRTTCNMRNCAQSRPADHNGVSLKSVLKPMQAPPPYSSAAGYMGYGTPSSMYLRAPPYGSSFFNGPALPPYDIPFSGGSAYHYEYGNRLSIGSPYGPFHMSGPPPYSGGSMMGTGSDFCLCNYYFFKVSQ